MPVPLSSSSPQVPAVALERRGSPRLRKLIRVAIAGPGQATTTFGARVVDISQGGLRLSVTRPVAVGSLLNVKPAAAGLWVPVTVTNCRRQQGRWEIGCHFTEMPPQSTLLLFC